MSIEPTNDQNFVAPDTDDLDAFTSLLDGKAKVLKTEDDEPKITNVEVDTDADDEDNTEVVETADDEAPDEDDDSEDTADDKPKKKVNRYQERINELTAKAREAERALAALKASEGLRFFLQRKAIKTLQMSEQTLFGLLKHKAAPTECTTTHLSRLYSVVMVLSGSLSNTQKTMYSIKTSLFALLTML